MVAADEWVEQLIKYVIARNGGPSLGALNGESSYVNRCSAVGWKHKANLIMQTGRQGTGSDGYPKVHWLLRKLCDSDLSAPCDFCHAGALRQVA